MMYVIISFVLAVVIFAVAVVCNNKGRKTLAGWLLALALAACGIVGDELVRWLLNVL